MAVEKELELDWSHKQPLKSEACGECKLHERCTKPYFEPVRHLHNDENGNPTNRILVVSDHPEVRDQQGPGTYYYRGMSQLKNRILQNLDCSYTLTTVVRCAPQGKDKPKPKQNKACEEEFLRKLVIQEKPRSVVCLGKEALNSMCRLAGLEPPKNMNDVKGSYVEAEELNLRIYSAEHQSKFIHSDTNQDALEEHYFKVFEKAEAYALGTDYRERVTFSLLRTPAEVMRLATAQMDKNEFAADIETNYPIFDKKGTKDTRRNSHFKPDFEVISLSISYYDARAKKYVIAVIVEEGLKDPVPLRRLFRGRRCVMHNHPYDSQGIFKGLGVDVFDICSSVDDTQLCFYLSDQNRLYTNLKDLARYYLDGVGDWESEGHELVVRANMLIVQQRKALEEQIKAKSADVITWGVYEKGKGQVMLSKEKAAWTRAAKKMLAAGYESEDQIHRMIAALKLKLKALPLPGLCSYADIPIVKLAEYNAEDTLRTLQLWREIIPAMEKLDGFTYDRDCYNMVKEMIRTACYVQREGFHINRQKMEALEERLLNREAAIREELLTFPNVLRAAQATKGYIEATAKGKVPLWDKIMSIKNNTFMGETAKAYGVYHLGNVTDTTVTFGKLVIPNIKAYFEKRAKKPEFVEGCRVFTLLEELRASMDLRSKFINNWKIWLCDDNKFHPEFKLVANQNLGYARGKDVGGGAQSGRSSCIADGTLIQTLGGEKPIEDIVPGELVFCYDELGNPRIESVEAVFDQGERETVWINYHDTLGKFKELCVTPDQLILTASAQWVEAGKLRPGDKLGGDRCPVVNAVQRGEVRQTRDLLISNYPNFIANGLICHNCLKPNLQQLFKLEELREIFEPENPEDWFIAELDYKSLEPMLMAYVTGCDRLKQVFWRSLDIYRVTCNDMYRKGVDMSLPDDVVRRLLEDPNTVSAKERKMFKVGFLAWVYGAGKMRLAATLGVSEDEALDFIRRAEKTYYEIFEWKNSIRDIIQAGGALHTYTGRRRTMPITPQQNSSEEEQERYRKDFGTAFRIGVNFPIQCLPEGTQVLTKDGYRAIEDCHLREVWDGEKWSQCLLHGGELKPLFEVRTNSGNVKMSPKHRVETQRGWVEAQHLVPGDRILRKDRYAPGGNHWGNVDFAEFMGLMIGDGNYSQPAKGGTLTVGSKEGDLLDWLQPRLSKWNSREDGKEKKGTVLWNSRRRLHKGKHSYDIVSVKLAALKLLEQHGLALGQGATAYNKCVPSSVFNARPEVRAGVLRGLFTADGCITGTPEKGFAIHYTTVGEQLAYDVHRLASSLGIQTYIHKFSNKQTTRGYNYRVTVAGADHVKFAELVGFMSKCKTRLLDVIVAYQECLDPSKVKDQRYATVKEVADLGSKVKMWDLQVNSERHAFVVDGLSVHNSLGSDITLVQASRIRRWIEKNNYHDVVKIVNLVHDSVWLYIKRTHAHLLQEIVAIMEDLSHFKFTLDVPLTVEYTIGYDLSESMGNDDKVIHMRTGLTQAALQELRKRELGIVDRKKAA